MKKYILNSLKIKSSIGDFLESRRDGEDEFETCNALITEIMNTYPELSRRTVQDSINKSEPESVVRTNNGLRLEQKEHFVNEMASSLERWIPYFHSSLQPHRN
ncbi:MAG: hypothetical protein WCP20_12960 [Desulfuromonadales bacterium]